MASYQSGGARRIVSQRKGFGAWRWTGIRYPGYAAPQLLCMIRGPRFRTRSSWVCVGANSRIPRVSSSDLLATATHPAESGARPPARSKTDVAARILVCPHRNSSGVTRSFPRARLSSLTCGRDENDRAVRRRQKFEASAEKHWKAPQHRFGGCGADCRIAGIADDSGGSRTPGSRHRKPGIRYQGTTAVDAFDCDAGRGRPGASVASEHHCGAGYPGAG